MHSDIALGQAPIGFSIYSEEGTLLFRRGSVIHMPDQISRLLVRGTQYNEAETIDPRPYASNEPPPEPVYEDPPPFDHLSGLLLEPQARTGHHPQKPRTNRRDRTYRQNGPAVQTICHKDVDSALAAPSVDTP